MGRHSIISVCFGFMVGEIRTQTMNELPKTLSQMSAVQKEAFVWALITSCWDAVMHMENWGGDLSPSDSGSEPVWMVPGIPVNKQELTCSSVHSSQIGWNKSSTLDFLTWFSAIQHQLMVWHYEKLSSLLGGSNPILRLWSEGQYRDRIQGNKLGSEA